MMASQTRRMMTGLATMAAVVALGYGTAWAETFTPHTPSQSVDCKLVDKAISKIPHGDGERPVTDDEVGPGGWRFNGDGMSFVTFAHTLNDNDTPDDKSDDFYDVVAGRSNVRGNDGIINDYPQHLDSPQDTKDEILIFDGKRNQITLSGASGMFEFAGKDEGEIKIQMHDSDGDGVFEGCAKSPLLKNFGFLVPEGGDFVQHEYFKAYAEVDEDGRVTFFELTEISTFKNVESDGN